MKNKLFFEKSMSIPKSAQETIPFIEAYDNGLFLVDNNKYTIIFAFDNIDYAMMRDQEQEEIYQKYTKLINSLPSDISYQEFIMNAKIDAEKLRNLLIPERKYDRLYDDYCMIQENMIEKAKNASAEKIMLIAMSYVPETKADNVNVLFKYYREMQTFFDNLKVSTHQLMPEEVFGVLFQYYHPYDNDEFKLPNNLFKKGAKIKDYIAPSMFNFKAKETEVGMAFTRVLYMKNYDRELDDEFIKDMTDNNLKVTFTKHLRRLDKGDACEKIRKEIYNVQTSIQGKKAKNKKDGTDFIPFRLTERLKELEDIQNQLSSSTMELFEVAVFISVSALTKDALDEATQSLINKARRHQVKLDVLVKQQEKAMASVLPFANNKFDGKLGNSISSYLLSDAAGVLMPFSYRSYFVENGLSYGNNIITNNVNILDRANEMNSNGFTIGSSGSGKSVETKMEIADVLFRYPDDEVIVIDPEREYLEMIKKENFDGEAFKLSADSNTKLNIFDIDMTYSEDGSNAITLKSSFIATVVETAKGMQLTSAELSIIDRIVRILYADYSRSLKEDDLPVLKDFYEKLKEQPEPEAQALALSLEIYTIGSFQCFSGKTNIETNKRFLVFDLFDMGEQLRAVGLQIILETVWQRVIKNKLRGIRTWVWIDEFSIMFTDGAGKETTKSGDFFALVYKRIRKHGGVVTGITQNIKEILASKQASTMLSNAEFVILLQQKNNEVKMISELFELSPSQELFIKSGEIGTGLIISGTKVIPFSKKIDKCDLYDMISTKFSEKQEKIKKMSNRQNRSIMLSDYEYEQIMFHSKKNNMEIGEYISSRCIV